MNSARVRRTARALLSFVLAAIVLGPPAGQFGHSSASQAHHAALAATAAVSTVPSALARQRGESTTPSQLWFGAQATHSRVAAPRVALLRRAGDGSSVALTAAPSDAAPRAPPVS